MVCVVGCHCSVSPALHFTLLSHNWGKGPQGLFSPTAPSLCFSFTDPRSQVFLSYDCGTGKIKYMSPLGEEVKSMNAWETQTDTLRDTGDLLKEQMPDVTPEKHLDKGELESPNAGGVD